jgi:hypothetical protein
MTQEFINNGFSMLLKKLISKGWIKAALDLAHPPENRGGADQNFEKPLMPVRNADYYQDSPHLF